MAGSVNKVILVGNLGRDPEIRSPTSGRESPTSGSRPPRPGATRAAASARAHRMAPGGDVQRPSGGCLRALPEEGQKVYVEGALQTRKWTDQSGAEKFSTEVVLQKFRGELTMLDGRSGGAGGGAEDDAGGGFSDSGSSSGSWTDGPRAGRRRRWGLGRRYPVLVLGWTLFVKMMQISNAAEVPFPSRPRTRLSSLQVCDACRPDSTSPSRC